MSRKKHFSESHIKSFLDQVFYSVKMADIGLVLFLRVYGT